ncbi:VCBS repeat-containing protein [Streptomyces bambusae]|uniref:FG-GAP repeat domain-containing protein n=1 Tax=Streptomyces bambusae TaxID=1550616 RepID=UPI001CFC6157|nr:VCBS repeat-containing protein [Streptomyces bambusae]MCB5167921.1 VCBS repeat-containing protein [Streptomyces bambusae]
MHSTRATRRGLGRVAACTAVALAAGTLLSAVPASAAGKSLPQPEVTRPKAAQPASYALVKAKPRLDFDADGKNDMLYRYVDGSLAVLPGNDGEESEFLIAGSATPGFKDVIPVGQLGGDARPELLTLTASGRLSLVSGNGPAGTGAATWSGNGWSIYNKVVSPGDLTKDGRPDLLARTPSGDLYLYKGTGQLSGKPFEARVKVGTGWHIYDQIVGTGDMDGDGLGDLVAKDVKGYLYSYKGSGVAATPYKPRLKVGAGWNMFNQVTALDDVTGDGRADIAGRTHAGKLYLYPSKGGGLFGARSELATGMEFVNLMVGQGGVPDYGKGALAYSVETSEGGDDGKTTQLFTHLALTNGEFLPAEESITTGHVDGVGFVAYASGLDDTNTPHALIDNDSLFNASVPGSGTILIPGEDGVMMSGERQLGPGDLTGDGKGDVLQVHSGVLYLFAGDGTGTRMTQTVKVGSGWSIYRGIAGSGDLTGDGRADVVAVDKSNNLFLYKGTGTAATPFAPRVQIATNWTGSLAAPGDINGDGRADLVTAKDGVMYRVTSTGLTGTALLSAPVKLAGDWPVKYLR